MIYQPLGSNPFDVDPTMCYIPERGMYEAPVVKPHPGSTSQVVFDPTLIQGDPGEQVDKDIEQARKKRWGWLVFVAAAGAAVYFTMKG